MKDIVLTNSDDRTKNATAIEIKGQLGTEVQAGRIEKAVGRKLKKAKVILSDGDIADLKKEIAGLLKAETNSQFEIGDKLLKLRREGGCKWPELGKEFGRNHTTLCTYSKVAEAFAPTIRDYSRDFSWYQAVYASEKITVKQLAEKQGIKVDPDYAKALKKCLDNSSLTRTSRAVTKFLVGMANAQLRKPQPSSIPSSCRHTAIEDFLRDSEPLQAQMIVADPPYGCFRKLDEGTCDTSTTRAQLSQCDNADRDKAIKTTVGFFDALGERLDEHLSPGGVVLLWQNEELRWQIAKAIEDAGLRVGRMIPWPKNGNGKPAEFNYPWSNCLETLYLIHRPTDTIGYGEHGKPVSNGEFLFRPIRQSRYSIEQHHHFEKPIDMLEFLIELHSMPGELVIDAYGCTGSCSVAAQRRGRRWVYVESNEENFRFGSERLALEIEPKTKEPDLEAESVPTDPVEDTAHEKSKKYCAETVPF